MIMVELSEGEKIEQAKVRMHIKMSKNGSSSAIATLVMIHLLF